MPKISALTSLAQASVDTAADVLPIVDATAPATTKKVTVQAMVNAGLAAAAPQGGIFALTGALTVSGQASITANSASAALTVTQTGAGNAFVVEDAASDTTPFVIDGAGQIGFGETALTGYAMRASIPITGAVNGYGLFLTNEIQSGVTTTANVFSSQPATAAAAFTLGELRHFFAQQYTIGSGSTVTNQYGFYAHTSLTLATNNFGFYSNIAAAANRYNFYAAGTADNYFGGLVECANYLRVFSATATPAGGAANTGLLMGSAVMGVYFGSGAPTVSAAKGSLYLRSDGSTTNDRMYVNTNGSTTWTAVITAA